MSIEDQTYWLVENQPKRIQFYPSRREDPSGTFVVHTAENATDLVLPDGGAEGVAGFIQRRATPGSYHSIFDSDSTVDLIPPWYTAFHDGTGSNRYSIGISFACRADQWPTLPDVWVEGAMAQAGRKVAELIAWLKANWGVEVPLARITGQEATQRLPGFTTHKEREDAAGTPGRRSDPGEGFPWNLFFTNIRANQTGDEVTDREVLDEILATVRLSTTPEKMVNAAYRQILGRKPDKTGFDYWVDKLNHEYPVAQMVRDFEAIAAG